MENIKKNPLSLQLNAEDFLPASNEESRVWWSCAKASTSGRTVSAA